MEALLARALMEELRTEIRRRDEALAAQIRSSMMAVPLDTLASAQGTAACIDAIWALLSEKGYITQEDALKSDTIGRACVYADAPWRKADCRERSGVCPYQLTALCPKVPRGDE